MRHRDGYDDRVQVLHLQHVPTLDLLCCYGTNLVASGADLRTAQTLLRHQSLQTTALYVAVADQRRVDAVDRLDPFA